MRVLMAGLGFSMHCRRPLRWLLDRGVEVVFVDGVDPAPAPGGDYRFEPYPVAPLARYYRRLLGRGVGDAVMHKAVARRLRSIVDRVKPDVVHVHWIDARAYQFALAGIKPLVLSAWGSDVNGAARPDADPESRRLVARALAGADAVIVDAADVAARCTELAGRPVRTAMIPLGIDTNNFRPGRAEDAARWREKLAVPDGAAVVLSVRAFATLYNHHLVLEAFALALPRLGRDAVLVLRTYNREYYPDSDAYEARLRRRIGELGLGPRVRWMTGVGHDELPGIYAFADVVVNYPSVDAFPVTLMEAAASGRPLVTVMLPAYEGSFVERYARLAEAQNPASLADALVAELTADPARRLPELAAARDVAVREYDQAVAADRMLQLYRSLLPAGGARDSTGLV